MAAEETTEKESAEKGGTLVSCAHRVERAAGEFRRGAPVLIPAGPADDGVLAAAAETVQDRTLHAMRSLGGDIFLLLTHARARTLKIRLYTPEVVALPMSKSMRAMDVRAVADPTIDLRRPLKGPFDAMRVLPSSSAAAAVRLAKLAGLLPAAVMVRLKGDDARRVRRDGGLSEITGDAILSFEESTAKTLSLVGRAKVPLEGAEEAEMAAFRPADGGPEHYALIIGRKTSAQLAPPGPVLARLHSECFTGDLLGSLKCDCGDQLRGAIKAIMAAGGGILLYLAQEGRGIGLMNKLRAYHLQDEGFDTMEANRRLGFAADERMYDVAARMLALLGYGKVRLMTNNPDKLRALEAAGITVVERVPHRFPDNVHNRDYLRAKVEKGGHLL